MTSRGVCLKKSPIDPQNVLQIIINKFFAAIKHLKYLVFKKKISNKSRGLKNTNLN